MAMEALAQTDLSSSHLLQSLVVLGSERIPHACLGVLIAPEYVLAPAQCVWEAQDPIEYAEFSFRSSSSNGSEEQEAGVVVKGDVIAIQNITFHPDFQGGSTLDHTASMDQDHHAASIVLDDLAVLRLAHARNESQGMPLVQKFPPPSFPNAMKDHLVVHVDPETLAMTATDGVVFVNNSACPITHSLAPSTAKDRGFACVIAMDIEERAALAQNGWSVLVQQSPTNEWFLGFGSSVDRRDAEISVEASAFLAFTYVYSFGDSFLQEPTVTGVEWDSDISLMAFGPSVQRITQFLGFMAGMRMQKDGTNFCGGSLIAPRVVLTAAHCADDAPVNWVSIGSLYTAGTADGEQIQVSSIVKHPSYVPQTKSFDVALVFLKYPSIQQPIALDRSDLVAGMTATALGYGVAKPDATQLSEVLRQVELPVVPSTKDCANTLHMLIDSSMVCAGGIAGEDACTGDSGGPLVLFENTPQTTMLGVVSFGRSCGFAGLPGVYSRVGSSMDFINTYVPQVRWTQSITKAGSTPATTSSQDPQTDPPASSVSAGRISSAASASATAGSSQDRTAESGGAAASTYALSANSSASALETVLSLLVPSSTAQQYQLTNNTQMALVSTADLDPLMSKINAFLTSPLWTRAKRFSQADSDTC